MRYFGFGAAVPTVIFCLLWIAAVLEWLVWSEPLLRWSIIAPFCLFLPGFFFHWRRPKLHIHESSFKVTLKAGSSPQFGYFVQGIASMIFFGVCSGIFMLLIRDRM